ncbi:glycosyltransferase family 2 protein [Nitratidesulfovibrio sp. 1201_IL3209]|uniref:glycosyltransferase family 2 protein n=1 Tax=Nitratidesulfovibrio sp. 1201_IL3209 TaxID=3084053 RepID=UPI002FD979C0
MTSPALARPRWRDLPGDLAAALLKGGVGQLHLVGIAEMALAAMNTPEGSAYGPASLFALGADALCAAWEADPLDGRTAGQLAALHKARPFLPTPVFRVAELLTALDAPPPEAEVRQLVRLLQQRDADASCRLLDRQCRARPGNTFWLRQAMVVGMTEARHQWLDAWLAGLPSGLRDGGGVPAPVVAALRGDVAFARGDMAGAAALYAAACKALPLVTWKVRHAESLYRAGDCDAALALWRAAADARPWQVNLLLRLDDVARGRDLPGDLPAGRGAVLFYTWNKAECIDEALASVAASDLGDARVVVLDNGCTDATPEVLARWAERAPNHPGGSLGERLLTVTLPLNIGAPPARNWLLTLPEVRACDWVAFLDDDATVPPDWLRLFGASMAAHPAANVHGCRVVDHAVPMLLQSVDLHLDPGGDMAAAPENAPGYRRRFSVSDLHLQELDFGQFSYLRPCVSVTGCCHLFRRAVFDAVGAFDLRYAPSQYDDLEHDLRRSLRGDLPVYQGHLAVRHMKRTGRSAWTDPAQFSNAWANMYKLQYRYARPDFDALRQHDHAALLADVEARGI